MIQQSKTEHYLLILLSNLLNNKNNLENLIN